jgi:hypothetical protein
MGIGIYLLAFIFYGAMVYLTKRAIYNRFALDSQAHILKWEEGHEHTLIISPDYWWAFRFKNRIKKMSPEGSKTSYLKDYVKVNNRMNLLFSVLLTTISLVAVSISSAAGVTQLVVALAVLRFISRSYEITYAFICDVFQKDGSETGLSKYERIKLALVSYLEIFFYSAAAYLALPQFSAPSDAITLSLNVGTLTNVGFAFTVCNQFESNTVFIQVFTTLSLVILSLASYLSRKE